MSEIKGMDELLGVLSGLGGDIKGALATGLGKGAKSIQKNAKMLCPVKTGALRNSIKTSVEVKDTEIDGKVYTNLDYAVYVELGTGQRGASSSIDRPEGVSYNPEVKGMAAQPYLAPAYLHAQNTHEVENQIAKQVQEEISKLGGK